MGNAQRVIELGLQKDNNNIPLLSNLIDIKLLNREFNEAEDLCKKLLTMKPESSGVFNALGSIAEKKGDFDLARKRFKKAIALNSKNIQAHVNIAAMLQHSGKTDEAIIAYEKILDNYANLDAK